MGSPFNSGCCYLPPFSLAPFFRVRRACSPKAIVFLAWPAHGCITPEYEPGRRPGTALAPAAKGEEWAAWSQCVRLFVDAPQAILRAVYKAREMNSELPSNSLLRVSSAPALACCIHLRSPFRRNSTLVIMRFALALVALSALSVSATSVYRRQMPG